MGTRFIVTYRDGHRYQGSVKNIVNPTWPSTPPNKRRDSRKSEEVSIHLMASGVEMVFLVRDGFLNNRKIIDHCIEGVIAIQDDIKNQGSLTENFWLSKWKMSNMKNKRYLECDPKDMANIKRKAEELGINTYLGRSKNSKHKDRGKRYVLILGPAPKALMKNCYNKH